jgi:hypothetical protein
MMRCFGRAACVSVLTIGALLSAATTACAGAWTRAAGEGQVIFTSGRRVAPMGGLTGGPVSHESSVSQIYVEYGLIDGLTIGGKSYIEFSSTDLERSSASLGAFLRKRVWQDGKGGVGSVQAGYDHPIEALVGNGLEYADPGAVPEAHLAGLYGRGWGGDWGNAFLSTGAAYHWRGEGTADDLRFELTGGYAPGRRVMGMLSLYGLGPLGAGTDPSLKIAPSVAYTMWPFLDRNEKKPAGKVRPSTVQLGFSYDLLSPGDGIGVMVSVWRSF